MDETKQEAWCCKVDCTDSALFEIWDEGGGIEDYTHACRKHVGDLLPEVPARVSLLSE